MSHAFVITSHGSIALAQPQSYEAKVWLLETAPDNAQFFGEALAIEPRYVDGFIDAAEAAGFYSRCRSLS